MATTGTGKSEPKDYLRGVIEKQLGISLVEFLPADYRPSDFSKHFLENTRRLIKTGPRLELRQIETLLCEQVDCRLRNKRQGGTKSKVVTASDVAKVLEELGPSDHDNSSREGSQPSRMAPKEHGIVGNASENDHGEANGSMLYHDGEQTPTTPVRAPAAIANGPKPESRPRVGPRKSLSPMISLLATSQRRSSASSTPLSSLSNRPARKRYLDETLAESDDREAEAQYNATIHQAHMTRIELTIKRMQDRVVQLQSEELQLQCDIGAYEEKLVGWRNLATDLQAVHARHAANPLLTHDQGVAGEDFVLAKLASLIVELQQDTHRVEKDVVDGGKRTMETLRTRIEELQEELEGHKTALVEAETKKRDLEGQLEEIQEQKAKIMDLEME